MFPSAQHREVVGLFDDAGPEVGSVRGFGETSVG